MAMTPDSVIFKTQAGVRLGFANNWIKSIESLATNDTSVKGGDVFALRMKRGKVFYGHPIEIKHNRVIFNAKFRGSITKRIGRIDRITREYAAVYDNMMSPNDFSANFLKKNPPNRGQLLGYHNGVILHRDELGMEQHLDLDKLRGYKINYPYQDITGYGRAIMFSPTGFGMSKGEIDYRNFMVGINSISYGVSDYLSVGVGTLSFLPYIDVKLNHDVGEYIHVSAGGYLFALFSYGYHASLSFGTPDYFLNFSYVKSKEIQSVDSDLNFDLWSFGSSIRVGPKSRFFAEFNIITTPPNPFGYDVFSTYGYANGFSWGLTRYRNKIRWDLGLMHTGPFANCFPLPCEPIHVPIFFVAFGYKFGI
ncbi:MAG: hypothetical protein IPN76_24345 [Saprospiraceae bacterium]|nr:hypothetical protein [Saprospiraceae bacterium]